jgi:hypothetical protein
MINLPLLPSATMLPKINLVEEECNLQGSAAASLSA